MHDLRHAIRMLLKSPGFTLTSVFMLALGIGGCTAIFTVVNSVLLRPLPYPHAERLVQLWEVATTGGRMNVPEANFADWERMAQSFEGMAMYNSALWPVIGGLEPVRVRVATVSSDFFNVLGIQPVMGRTPSLEAGEPSAVVSYGFWQRVMGSDTNLASKRLIWSGVAYSVAGVMPPGFSFPPGTEVWGPREFSSQGPPKPSRSAHNWSVIARLKDGSSLEAGRSEISTIVRQLREQFGGQDFTAVDGTAISLREQLTQNVRTALPVLFGSVLILLLIACANVSNLLLAHGAGRQQELAVRSALGAGRRDLIRLFVTQSLVLSALGAAGGVLIAVAGVDALLAISADNLPRIDEIQVDVPVLAFSIVMTLAVGLVLGIVPAYRIGRGNLDEVMKEGGRQSQGRSHRGTRSALIVSQVALTLMLLIGAGLLSRSFVRILQVQLGFETSNRLMVDLQVSRPSGVSSSNARPRFTAFYQELMQRIAAMPGVRSVGGISQIPLSGRDSNGRFGIEGGRNSGQYWPGYRVASAGYFETMGIPLIAGRVFDQADGAGSPQVAVISKTVADTVWPGEDPIARRITFGNMDGDPTLMTIVGIVGDVRQVGPEAPTRGEIYVNFLQRGPVDTFTVVVAATTAADGLARTIGSNVRQLNSEATVRFQTFEQAFSSVLANRRFNLLLLGVFGAVALALAMLGVYSVTAYAVAQRTQEIGIRMALGARPKDVVGLFVSDGARLVGIGIVLGVIGSIAASRVMTSLLYEVAPTDVTTYAAAIAPLLMASLLASHLPARRAARVDPSKTIQGIRGQST
jgi:predicted permease